MKEGYMLINKFCLFAFLSLTLVSTATADVITVGPNGDYQTIQDAVNASSSGDEIIVAPGQYTSSSSWAPVVGIYNKNIWLHSSDGPEKTFIDGSTKNYHARCIETYWLDSNAHIEGFTIRNGSPLQGNGGGINNNYASPTISDCIFENNEAGYTGGYLGSYTNGGGAIYNLQSNPSIINCVFRGNRASANGGAICNTNYSSPSIVNCLFELNVAEKGGAISFGSSSSCSLSGCIFQQNSAEFYGGAIYLVEGCEISITATYFESNVSVLGGGGIYNQGGIFSVTGCYFNQNVSLPGNGGGINLMGSSTATLNNSEFTGNSAVNGGGISVSSLSWINIGNSTFCENSGGDIVGKWGSLGDNEFNESCTGTDGACCTNNNCVLIDSETCNYVGGEFKGLDTECVDDICPEGCPADLSGDGLVEVNDILEIISAWGACP